MASLKPTDARPLRNFLDTTLKKFSGKTPIAVIATVADELQAKQKTVHRAVTIDWTKSETETQTLGIRDELGFCGNRLRGVVDGLAKGAVRPIPHRLANSYVVEAIDRLKKVFAAIDAFIVASGVPEELEPEQELAASKQKFTKTIHSLADLNELYKKLNEIPVADKSVDIQKEIDEALQDEKPRAKPTITTKPESKYSVDRDVAYEKRLLEQLPALVKLTEDLEAKYRSKLPKPNSQQAAIFRSMPLLLTYNSDATYKLYAGKLKNTHIKYHQLPSNYGLILEDQIVIGVHRKIADDKKRFEATIEKVLEIIENRRNEEYVVIRQSKNEAKWFLTSDAPAFAFVWVLPQFVASKLGTFTVDWLGFPWSSSKLKPKDITTPEAMERTSSLKDRRAKFEEVFAQLPAVIKLKAGIEKLEEALTEIRGKLEDKESEHDEIAEKISTREALKKSNSETKDKTWRIKVKNAQKSIEELQPQLEESAEDLKELRQFRMKASKAIKVAQDKLTTLRNNELKKLRLA